MVMVRLAVMKREEKGTLLGEDGVISDFGRRTGTAVIRSGNGVHQIEKAKGTLWGEVCVGGGS